MSALALILVATIMDPRFICPCGDQGSPDAIPSFPTFKVTEDESTDKGKSFFDARERGKE
jgi:hypothetical protein